VIFISDSSDAPNIGAEYDITIFDKDGNEKRRFGGEANCFVKGFMDYLQYLSRNGSGATKALSTTDTSGVARSVDQSAGSGYTGPGGVRTIAVAANTTRGIVCGRSGGPVTIRDHSVGELIGTEHLGYGASAVQPVAYSGNVATIELSRSFINTSTATVAGISSIAVYARPFLVATWSFMILRDVVPAFDLQPGEAATVVYRIVFNGGS
jgi:hypothetical protein